MLTNLIAQLQNAQVYPHAVKPPIEVLQTHCSAVFLTGDYAYKVKKPVDFGFLDFSTLEKRKFYLEQELALNQPIAPDIYEAVVPIYQDGEENLWVNQPQETLVEYALRMRQFPQSCLFVNLFKAGQLTPELIRELGLTVAEFHAQTRTDTYIQSFGQVEKIQDAIMDNFKATEKYIGAAQTQSQYAETKAFDEAFLRQHRDRFQRRIEAGKIRECHGDLHLQNICYWQGKLQLFDRIEFNEPFRFVDVMYDVAFTVMDLDAKERRDLGTIFLNAYLEQTGDWEGVSLLPFYLSRQAYVRAKVTSFLLDDPQISPREKETALETAQNYYRQAWGYAQPQEGEVILLSGLSGAGKSTVARYLAPQIGALHLRSDAIRKQLAGLPLTAQGGADLYTPERTQQTYQYLQNWGLALACQGWRVILDAKYDRRVERQTILKFCQTHHLPLIFLHCQASLPTLTERLNQRRGDISDATAALLRQQVENFEAFGAEESPFLVNLDTETFAWQEKIVFLNLGTIGGAKETVAKS
ncbi:MAG: AAA family ATPase [Cyanobacteriota bacterium]|jgi:aminoglycoside phosphotransferase family enzyme/predicted kinase